MKALKIPELSQDIQDNKTRLMFINEEIKRQRRK